MPKNGVLKVPSEYFDPVTHDSVSDAAVHQIEALILNGVLRGGAKLPGERELAEQFAISRPKVREALQKLEDRDLVEITRGDGAYITQLGAAAMSPALINLYKRHPSAIYDHLEYRREQESFAARLAASRSTKVDRSVITELLAAMTEAHVSDDHKLGDELDSRFHASVVNASHNRILIHMMTSLYELNRSGLFFSRREILNIEEVSEFLLSQHHAIGEAICSGQVENASEAAAAHIDFVILSTSEALSERERESVSEKRKLII